MSTREKAMSLLQEMPDQVIEMVYAFMRSVLDHPDRITAPSSAFGIAHKYANPALIGSERGAFEDAVVEKYEADRRKRDPSIPSE